MEGGGGGGGRAGGVGRVGGGGRWSIGLGTGHCPVETEKGSCKCNSCSPSWGREGRGRGGTELGGGRCGEGEEGALS